jgi:hypothetical protein
VKWRRWIVISASALAPLSASAAAAAGSWQGLRSVSVTVVNSSLPPPGGKPHTSSFLPGHGLKHAQKALNSHGIRRLASSVQNKGCTGGYDVTIKIVKHDASTVTLHAYRCGNTTYGRTGGDVPGFLKALGITPP